MPLIPMSVHLVAVFEREALVEAHWGDFCNRNYLELSERIRQRDAVIENIQFVGNRQIIQSVVAFLREVQLGDIGKLVCLYAVLMKIMLVLISRVQNTLEVCRNGYLRPDILNSVSLNSQGLLVLS
ncbi:hypothetical protein Tco_0815288 [Tanacetum coccineum]